MALAEVVAMEVGAAIAKSIIKLWLKDSILDDISSSVVDLLKSHTSDVLAQRRGQRQFETIGEKVAENLLPLFQMEGVRLKENSRIAVAYAVATAFNKSKFTSQMLVEHNLEPTTLAKHILDAYPAATQSFNSIESALYERIINESCTYIVDIASQLPVFTERTFAEVLKREDQLLFAVDQLLREIRQVQKQLNPLAEAGRFEIDYRRSVARNLDTLQLLGTDISTANRRHRLSVAYIMLSVGQKSVRKSNTTSQESDTIRNQDTQLPTSSQDDTDKRVVSVDTTLTSARRLLIRGVAGSGKTTLLQWVAVKAASRSFEAHLSEWNDTVPFYIRLRQCVLSGLPKPEAFPELVAPAIANTMPRGWVHMILELGRAIVLVDGLDEVPALRREDVRTWLKELVETYSQSRFIVTSRPHAVEEGWLDRENFYDAELMPMRLADIYSFVDHWHSAVREELYEDGEKIELGPLAEHLKDEFRKNRSLRGLATNPLLCAMICALNRERRQQLPSDRIELYEACCSLLLERRDKARNIDLADFPTINYRQKRFLLEDLSYWMIKNNWSEISLESIDERFTRKLMNMSGNLQDVSGSNVRRFLIERTGIIREPVKGQVDFTHLTFQEFLAAQAASDEIDIGVLIANAKSDQWREVIILASGLANRQMREDLIKGLIENGDADKKHRYQLHLLAVSCLETSIEVKFHLRTEVERRLSQLIPPKNMDDAKAMAAAGELAVKHLVKGNYSSFARAASVRCLAIIGTEAALEILEGYIGDAHEDVINELIRAWDSFERETYAARVLAPALRYKTDLCLELLPSLEGIKHFTNLAFLSLSRSSYTSDFSPLEELKQLKSLNLSHCSYLKDLSSLTNLVQITSLNLSGCSFNSLDPLVSLKKLVALDISNCPNINDLSSIASLPHLQSLTLNLSDWRQLLIAGLPHLHSLTLLKCSNIDYKNNLSILKQLTSLSFKESRLEDLSSLAYLTQLTSLEVSNSGLLTNITHLAELKQLTSLTISSCNSLGNLKPLAGLTQLTFLSLSGCSVLSNLKPLAGLTQLTTLDLSNCFYIRDLTPLAGLTQLTTLNLSDCRSITDLSPLFALPSLQEFRYSGALSALPQDFKRRVKVNTR